ncbi:MAG TPA: hypothetical protein VK628_06125 [Flavitalea sp.]|jgi:hypothetical protein|nr:hypothetical protein [Flavitalea sp.]
MLFYLVAEKSQEAICLVRESNRNSFLLKMGDKVISCSQHIRQLLPRLELMDSKGYTFSDN